MESYETLTCHGPCKYQGPLDEWAKEVMACEDCKKAIERKPSDTISWFSRQFCTKHNEAQPKQHCDCHTSVSIKGWGEVFGVMAELGEPLLCVTYSRDFNFK